MSGRSEKSVPSPEGTAAVLAVSPLPADRVRLREILSQGNWKLHEASDCGEALALLRGQNVPVLEAALGQKTNAKARIGPPALGSRAKCSMS